MRSSTVRLLSTFTCFLFAWQPLSAGESVPIAVNFPISGNLENIQHQVQKNGVAFQCLFQNLSYQGEVTRAVIEQKSNDQATLWLGMKNLRLSIQGISLAGSVGQANCGPLQLTMGHRKELWIAFDLARVMQNGQPQLSVQGTRFQLPPDNWAIGEPAWVRTSGLLMNERSVREGLRNGLRNSRQRVEHRLMQGAPGMLTKVCQVAADPQRPERKIVEAMRSALLSPPAATTATAGAAVSQAGTPKRLPRPPINAATQDMTASR
ncbi:hypothetical protein [Thalassoroseus pseudoceratinae]|uniref:hypothetical protein n=1 Tax=Thalassoroseus pseudoceratinae TaxID=2713176 RepID=UPI00142184CB|nr:hypothetical protein [Thalassoroseus pseudoceratinae]